MEITATHNNTSVQNPDSAGSLYDQAREMVGGARNGALVNTRELAQQLLQVQAADPVHGAQLQQAVEQQLDMADTGRLSQDLEAVAAVDHAAEVDGATAARPDTIDELITTVQSEFPAAAIRVTGRARTIARQAELMAERILTNRQEFLGTYRAAPHITEMDNWVQANPDATGQQTTAAFEDIIRRARANGAVVSNHLSDSARDISWPRGNAQQLVAVEARIEELGAEVIREPNAAGGRHWHVD